MLKPSDVKNTLNSLKTVKSNTQESLKSPKKNQKRPRYSVDLTNYRTSNAQVLG